VSPFRALLSQQPDLFSLTARTLNPLSAYSCKLFGAVEKPNSFAIKQMQTLCAKHPGWGMPATSPRLKSATYKLFPPRLVCKQVTPLPAPQRAAFSRVSGHKSLPRGCRVPRRLCGLCASVANPSLLAKSSRIHIHAKSPDNPFLPRWKTTGIYRTLSRARCLSAIDFQTLYFHGLTNPFSRNSFHCTSIQNPRGVRPLRTLCTLRLCVQARFSYALGPC
jgi:hypothetical protein